MNAEEFQKHIKDLEKEFKDFFDKAGPVIVGNEAVSRFKKNFRDEGFFGEKWKEVQRRTPGTKTYKAVAKHHPADTNRAILTGRTADLGRSIEVKEAGNGQAVVWTNPGAFTHSKEPYGKVHNEGLKAGRGSGFIMPKRQFMGENEQLNKAIIDKLTTKMNNILNKK
jgi:phage gpG-like protein